MPPVASRKRQRSKTPEIELIEETEIRQEPKRRKTNNLGFFSAVANAFHTVKNYFSGPASPVKTMSFKRSDLNQSQNDDDDEVR